MIKNKKLLPKVRDRISYMFIEKARIEQDEFSIKIITGSEERTIPTATVSVVFLGPGVSITHAAVKNLCESGCTLIWCGEEQWRVYTYSETLTKSSKHILMQCKYHESKVLRLEAIRRMYQMRYPNEHLKSADLDKLKGVEGYQVQTLYRTLAKQHGIVWNGRSYRVDDFNSQDDINKAITYANQILYGVIGSALHLMGFSSALGFIHIGHMNSFIFDIADLYKEEISIPVAFESVANCGNFDSAVVSGKMRQAFIDKRLMSRIPKDLERIFEEDDLELPEMVLWDGK